MQAIDNFLRRISDAVGVIGVLAIFSLMMLTVVTVIFRAMHIAFPGTYSISELLLIPAVSISVAYAALHNEHTRATLFVERIKNTRLRLAVHGAMLILGSLFWVAVVLATIREAMLSSTGPVTNTMRSRSRRLKMSKLRSPRLVLSTTTGTSAPVIGSRVNWPCAP